jgi:hypothetical protein
MFDVSIIFPEAVNSFIEIWDTDEPTTHLPILIK